MTPKQQRFVDYYLSNGFNATDAAKSAGYSEKSAYSQGQRLLKHVEVKKAVEKKQSNLRKNTKVKAEKIIAELAKIAFSNIKDIADWESASVRFKSSEDIPDEIAACIQEISEHSTQTQFGGSQTLRLKLYDKQRALEMLGKYLGLWVEKHEHSGPDGKPLQVQPVDPRLIVQDAAKLLKESEGGEEEFE